MSQISPPMRIALAVAVLFGVAYMLVLKPKNETASAPATPVATQAPASASASDGNAASTGLGKAVEAAHGAADATENSQAAQAGETTAPATSAPSTTQSTPSTSSSSSTPAETAPEPASDATLAGLPKWLQESMDHKVVAILFTHDTSADDRRTSDALDQAYTAHGKVVTRAVPVRLISRYRPVAEGVDVSQSPTLMVIDRNRSAQTLVGYSNVTAINQAIIDGLLATDNPVEHVKYLQTVQHECRQITNQAIIGETGGSSIKDARQNIDALIVTMSSSLGTLKNAPVPNAYHSLSKQVNQYISSELAAGRSIRSTAFGKKSVDPVKVREINARNDKLEHRTKLELNAVGVDACN